LKIVGRPPFPNFDFQTYIFHLSGNYLRPVYVFRHLLWPIALLYGAGVAIRNLLFDIGLLRSRTFDVPVIAVGNLEMGGTGKSPLVLHICGHLLGKGLRVAMLSRGYGRSTGGFLIVDEKRTAAEVGDEPLQAKLRFPEMTVAVCESRLEGIQKLLSRKDTPLVIVLDDAFQHRWVKPSLNILVTPSAQPFWKNQLFPVGTLREWASGAKRADVLVMIGKEEAASSVGFDGAMFRTRSSSSEPRAMFDKPHQLNDGDSVLLLSGIARPERFRQTAELSYNILAHQIHADHHVFSEKDLLGLRDAFHSFDPPPKAILTTEKDAARLHNAPFRSIIKDLPVFILPILLEWNGADEQNFNQLIDQHAASNKRDR